jgi:hypothetical protein
LNVFPEYQGFPYPSLNKNTLPFYVFPAIILTGFMTSIFIIKSKKDTVAAFCILLISLLGIVFLNQVRVRSDMIHLLPSALTSMVLAPILLHTLQAVYPVKPWLHRVLFFLFIIVFGTTLFKPIGKILMLYPKGYTLQSENPDLERVRYLKIPSDLKKTVSYVKNNTQKSEYIYIGVKNHDKLIFNHVVIYFLADRKSGTRYHELNAGLTNTFTIQEEMLSELKDKAVRLVVLTPGWWYEPNLSNIDANINLLDNYISTNYELKKKYGLFEIWTRIY